MLKKVLILDFPITDRNVKKGDIGHIDYNDNLNEIFVKGSWFKFDEKWSVLNIDEKNLEFFSYVLSLAQKNNINFLIVKDENIKYPNSEMLCSGYFVDNGNPELGIAIGGNILDWLPILVHEFSHMQQYLEKSEHWKNNFINGIETIDIIDRWINGDEIDNIEKLIELSYSVESDCEIRSIENIKKFNLDIDIPTYYQKANSYILFYASILEHRKWYDKDKKPYLIKDVYSFMPNDKIIIDYKNEYHLYKSLYDNYCF